MFSNIEEANWAFELLQIAANNLEIQDSEDPMFAVTSRYMAGGNRIHFNYGHWLVMGINGTPNGIKSLSLGLETDKIALPWLYQGKFFQPEGEKPITLYELSIEDFRDHQDEILDIFARSMVAVKDHFSSWTKTPYKRAQTKLLADAVLDPEIREKVINSGIENVGEDPPVGVTGIGKLRLVKTPGIGMPVCRGVYHDRLGRNR